MIGGDTIDHDTVEYLQLIVHTNYCKVAVRRFARSLATSIMRSQLPSGSFL